MSFSSLSLSNRSCETTESRLLVAISMLPIPCSPHPALSARVGRSVKSVSSRLCDYSNRRGDAGPPRAWRGRCQIGNRTEGEPASLQGEPVAARPQGVNLANLAKMANISGVRRSRRLLTQTFVSVVPTRCLVLVIQRGVSPVALVTATLQHQD